MNLTEFVIEIIRLQIIRQSNKPEIWLRTIKQMKNSFHSDNFICLINATLQALTLSNNLTQSPSALQSRLIRKVHHIGCIRLIFCVCCSISMSLLLQRCFFNKHKFTVYNPRFLNASANALLIGSFASFACFFI